VAGQHKGHATTDIVQAAKKSGKHIRRDVKLITEQAGEYQRKIRHVQRERASFTEEVSTAKLDVTRRTDELIKLIEKNKKQMLQVLFDLISEYLSHQIQENFYINCVDVNMTHL